MFTGIDRTAFAAFAWLPRYVIFGKLGHKTQLGTTYLYTDSPPRLLYIVSKPNVRSQTWIFFSKVIFTHMI